MADLVATARPRCRARRRPRRGDPKVHPLRLEVAPGRHGAQVVVDLVGAADSGWHGEDLVIGDQAHALDPDRPDEAGWRAVTKDRLALAGGELVHAEAQRALGLVEVSVPAHQRHDRLALGLEDERLNELLGRDAQELADLGDGPDARGLDELQAPSRASCTGAGAASAAFSMLAA